jgi:hypothetical protein
MLMGCLNCPRYPDFSFFPVQFDHRKTANPKTAASTAAAAAPPCLVSTAPAFLVAVVAGDSVLDGELEV